MDSSPPFDRTQIATKDDIQSLDPRLDVINKRFDLIDMRFDLIDQRFDLVEARLEAKMLRITIGSTLTSVGVLAGLMALLS